MRKKKINTVVIECIESDNVHMLVHRKSLLLINESSEILLLGKQLPVNKTEQFNSFLVDTDIKHSEDNTIPLFTEVWGIIEREPTLNCTAYRIL